MARDFYSSDIGFIDLFYIRLFDFFLFFSIYFNLTKTTIVLLCVFVKDLAKTKVLNMIKNNYILFLYE